MEEKLIYLPLREEHNTEDIWGQIWKKLIGWNHISLRKFQALVSWEPDT